MFAAPDPCVRERIQDDYQAFSMSVFRTSRDRARCHPRGVRRARPL